MPGILRHVEKLKYVEDDIGDRDKFLEFNPCVYMERKWIFSLGAPILGQRNGLQGCTIHEY
jgi:hypothetical protein